MKEEFQQKLINDFPHLYSETKLSPQESCMHWGFECGDGWFNLIYELSKEITKIDPKCKASQVKEKFGGLRFYCKTSLIEVDNIIDKYECKSYHICENCGKDGSSKKEINGYLSTLCKDCFNSRKNQKE